jgi:hypothetical protein
VAADDLEKLVARQHQLGDHRHQRLERIDVDADRLVGDPALELVVLALPRILGAGRRLRGFLLLGRGSFGGEQGDLDLGLAKSSLEFVERDFADTERPLQGLGYEAADGGSLALALGGRLGGGEGHPLEVCDEVLVVALGLRLVRLERGEDLLDAVDGRQDERYGFVGDGGSVTEFAHQGLGRMGEGLETRQAEEAAGALDRVHQAEHVVEDLEIVRVGLELDELHVHDVEAFARLGQKFSEQIVHRATLGRHNGPHIQGKASPQRVDDVLAATCKCKGNPARPRRPPSAVRRPPSAVRRPPSAVRRHAPR